MSKREIPSSKKDSGIHREGPKLFASTILSNIDLTKLTPKPSGIDTTKSKHEAGTSPKIPALEVPQTSKSDVTMSSKTNENMIQPNQHSNISDASVSNALLESKNHSANINAGSSHAPLQSPSGAPKLFATALLSQLNVSTLQPSVTSNKSVKTHTSKNQPEPAIVMTVSKHEMSHEKPQQTPFIDSVRKPSLMHQNQNETSRLFASTLLSQIDPSILRITPSSVKHTSSSIRNTPTEIKSNSGPADNPRNKSSTSRSASRLALESEPDATTPHGSSKSATEQGMMDMDVNSIEPTRQENPADSSNTKSIPVSSSPSRFPQPMATTILSQTNPSVTTSSPLVDESLTRTGAIDKSEDFKSQTKLEEIAAISNPSQLPQNVPTNQKSDQLPTSSTTPTSSQTNSKLSSPTNVGDQFLGPILSQSEHDSYSTPNLSIIPLVPMDTNNKVGGQDGDKSVAIVDDIGSSEIVKPFDDSTEMEGRSMQRYSGMDINVQPSRSTHNVRKMEHDQPNDNSNLIVESNVAVVQESKKNESLLVTSQDTTDSKTNIPENKEIEEKLPEPEPNKSQSNSLEKSSKGSAKSENSVVPTPKKSETGKSGVDKPLDEKPPEKDDSGGVSKTPSKLVAGPTPADNQSKPKGTCCPCFKKKKADEKSGEKTPSKCCKCCKLKCCKSCNCSKATCLNPLCAVIWIVFVTGVALILHLIFEPCVDVDLSQKSGNGFFLTLGVILSIAFIAFVLTCCIIFLILMKLGVRHKCWRIIKQLILAVHLLFGATVAILVYTIFYKLKEQPDAKETICSKKCFVYVLVMLVLGVIPYVVFSLVYRKIRTGIHPAKTTGLSKSTIGKSPCDCSSFIRRKTMSQLPKLAEPIQPVNDNGLLEKDMSITAASEPSRMTGLYRSTTQSNHRRSVRYSTYQSASTNRQTRPAVPNNQHVFVNVLSLK